MRLLIKPVGKECARTGRDPGDRWRMVVCLLLLLAFPSGSVSAGSDGIPGGPTRGVRLTRKVPFASESFGEIRALARSRMPKASRRRTIPFLGISATLAPVRRATEPATVPAAPSPLPQELVVLLAPALDRSFPGLGNPPDAEGDVVPPNAMGAAGPAHLVTFLNSGFGVF
ncbi:MAG: hypothetical protein H6Q79_1522, partial [Deltaproteobacteria bacterium]|nr:hypothetical protein [Deltaproteobacteria bacterium]